MKKIMIPFKDFIQKQKIQSNHTPVLIREVIEQLNLKDNDRYLDLTFGAGGYTHFVNNSVSNLEITAFDQDESVKKYVDIFEIQHQKKINFICDNFSNIDKYEIGKFDGIVADLGVSSMQLDEGDRGFSFQNNGPLDMRMSHKFTITAKDVVNSFKEEELADIFFYYGDETKSRLAASAIVNKRQEKLIETTFELADIIRKVLDRFYYKSKIDSATKCFQALRIYVNKELSSLEDMLLKTLNLLNPNGRLVIVSFHSLEDAIVKKFFLENSDKKVAISKYKEQKAREKPLIILTKKPIEPQRDEVLFNARSRSSKLRACEFAGGILDN
jgi:16S rRNA (cytosine1402-N4)-methyltransferase